MLLVGGRPEIGDVVGRSGKNREGGVGVGVPVVGLEGGSVGTASAVEHGDGHIL